jgi:aminopeptidase
LAEVLVGHSLAVRAGERVQIEGTALPDEMAIALMRAVRRRGGRPFFNGHSLRIRREFMVNGEWEDFQLVGALALEEIRQMQCCVILRGADNAFELGDVPTEKQRIFEQAMKPARDHRVGKTRWVLLRWPSQAMAQLAKMSTEAFEDFFFRVCTLDYSRMESAMGALKDLMERTDQVRIVSPGTDLRFSIRSIGATPCCGHCNIPDGEIYTAPVRDSVEGTIAYNAPSVYRGMCFDGVRFRFEGGRIVEATANDTPALNDILNSDEGARYVGEFALGVNPHILHPFCDILFDEKIAGSLHFTPGQAYEGPSDNGNRSQIHWDLVLIQRPDYGGGEVYFDGKLLRKDGLFLPEELRALNPDRLLGQ